MRRRTTYAVVHCSATRPEQDWGVEEIDQLHRNPPFGFDSVGYHVVIRRDGTIEFGRHFDAVGAHVKGDNFRSVGICLVGGIDDSGASVNNFTDEQFESLHTVLCMLQRAYPGIEALGHRDLSPDIDGDGVIDRSEWLKDCPCFDVAAWWEEYAAAA